MASEETIANTIYQVAKAGTSVNPGLPDSLAKLVVAQSKFETASSVGGSFLPYTSNAFIKDNNSFGYKYVGSKYQTGPGIKSSEGDNYGHYANIGDSVREVVDWIYRRKNEGLFPANLATIVTPLQYATYLKKTGYFGVTAEHYANGLLTWSGGTISAKTAGIGILGGLALISILIYSLKHKQNV